MNSRSARLARGWVVGVIATAAAALSHAVAGGGTPSPLALGVGVVFGGMLGTFALRSRPSLPRLAIAVGVSQLAFHVAFSTLGTAAPVAGHDHGAMTVMQPVHAHPADPGMWLAHAAAGLLTLALLRGAERAAWRLLTELARLVVAPFRAPADVPVPARPAPASRISSTPARFRSRVTTSALSRRGPPVSAAF